MAVIETSLPLGMRVRISARPTSTVSSMSWYAALSKALEVVAWYLVRFLFVFLKCMFTDALKFEKGP